MSVGGADELVEAVEEWSDGITQGSLIEVLLDNLDLPQEYSRSGPAMRMGFSSEDAFLAVTYTTAWATEEESDEEQKCCDQIRCILGNPFRPVSLDPSWLTSTVVALAEGIYADRAFDRLPILAGALEDAGCGHADILAHCRGDGPHARGCWVVDLVLGKE
jgi:hypothetical protein